MAPKEMKVKATDDFEVTGDGSNAAWKKAEWEPLNQRSKNGADYETKVKALYSKKGIYFLMEGSDKKINAKITEDFASSATICPISPERSMFARSFSRLAAEPL